MFLRSPQSRPIPERLQAATKSATAPNMPKLLDDTPQESRHERLGVGQQVGWFYQKGANVQLTIEELPSELSVAKM